jgi:hypothetical protein
MEGYAGPNPVTIAPTQIMVLSSALHAPRQELITQAELFSTGPVQAAVVYTKVRLTNAEVESVLTRGSS